jgi:hypothetical protein
MTQRIENQDWSGARFNNIDFTGAKIVEGNFDGADFNGYVGTLKVNGIHVWPLIDAELNRRHPERAKLRPSDPEGCREALAIIEGQLDQTWKRARALTEDQRNERVDEEWSVVETTRHLVLVIDAWLGKNIKGEEDPYHPIALPPTSMPRKPPDTSIDPDAHPAFEEALDVWDGRLGSLREFVDSITPEELERPIDNPYDPNVRAALWVIFEELWAHNQFMNRDMSVLEDA